MVSYLYHCCHRKPFFPPQTRFWWGFSFHDITWTEAFHGLIKSTSFTTCYECSIMDHSGFENLAHLHLIYFTNARLRLSFVWCLCWLFLYQLNLFLKQEDWWQVLNRMHPTPTHLPSTISQVFGIWMSFSSHFWRNWNLFTFFAWLSQAVRCCCNTVLASMKSCLVSLHRCRQVPS